MKLLRQTSVIIGIHQSEKKLTFLILTYAKESFFQQINVKLTKQLAPLQTDDIETYLSTNSKTTFVQVTEYPRDKLNHILLLDEIENDEQRSKCIT